MAAMVRSSGPQDFKIAVLGVPAELIAVHTAVSQPVAEAMATGVPVFFALPWPVNGWSAVLLVPYLAWICYDCSDARRAMSAADCCVTKLDELAGASAVCATAWPAISINAKVDPARYGLYDFIGVGSFHLLHGRGRAADTKSLRRPWRRVTSGG